MLQSITERNEWKFFSVLPKAAPRLALLWWIALLFRGLLPAAFAVAMGVLVGAVQRGGHLTGPLTIVGATSPLSRNPSCVKRAAIPKKSLSIHLS